MYNHFCQLSHSLTILPKSNRQQNKMHHIYTFYIYYIYITNIWSFLYFSMLKYHILYYIWGQDANIWSKSLLQTWLIAERRLEAKSHDLFIKDDWSTKAWPSNKSLIVTQISPFLLSLLLFFFCPSCQKSGFFELLPPPKCFPALSTLPWGHERQTTYSCKLMISGWIFAPLLVSCWFFRQKACVGPTQRIAHEPGLWSTWGRVVFVCSDSAAVNDDAHRLSCMISLTDMVRTRLLAFFSFHHSLSHRRKGTFIFHLGDDRRHAMHFPPFITFPTALGASFMCRFHAQTHTRGCTFIHTLCRETRVGLVAFHSVFHGHEHLQ